MTFCRADGTANAYDYVRKPYRGLKIASNTNIWHRILTARAHPYHAEAQMLAI